MASHKVTIIFTCPAISEILQNVTLCMWDIKLVSFEITVLEMCDLMLRTKFLLLIRHVKRQVKTQQKY